MVSGYNVNKRERFCKALAPCSLLPGHPDHGLRTVLVVPFLGTGWQGCKCPRLYSTELNTPLLVGSGQTLGKRISE